MRCLTEELGGRGGCGLLDGFIKKEVVETGLRSLAFTDVFRAFKDDYNAGWATFFAGVLFHLDHPSWEEDYPNLSPPGTL